MDRIEAGPSQVCIITGGFDRPYACGLSLAVAARGVALDVIGSDDLDRSEMHATPALRFLNLQRKPRQKASLAMRAFRVAAFYARLVGYAAAAKPKVFHILWNNKLEYLDRTLLLLYYKLCGKKLILTAHNVNAGKRDATDSAMNRLTLKIQYRLVDYIFVHTEKMKRELMEDFGVPERSIGLVPFGVNNAVPDTQLTQAGARRLLGIRQGERVVLFFGNIGPYKGLKFLVAGFQQIIRHAEYRLMIAGKARGGCAGYVEEVREAIDSGGLQERVTMRVEYIPDEETEVYFKAADVLALPYTQICQSGVLFLAYSFGLPVIATDVGSFQEDVVEGKTGFLCESCNPDDLAKAIEKYFDSDLFKELAERRREIKDYVRARNSWETVSEITCKVYAGFLGKAGIA